MARAKITRTAPTLATVIAEIDELAKLETVFISSCEENLADRGIQAPRHDADDADHIAYAIALRNEIRASYGV